MSLWNSNIFRLVLRVIGKECLAIYQYPSIDTMDFKVPERYLVSGRVDQIACIPAFVTDGKVRETFFVY